MQGFEQLAVTPYFNCARHGAVVWAGSGTHAEESELISADGHILSGLEHNVLLDFIPLDQRDADDEHGDAEMGEQHAVIRRRVGGKLVEQTGSVRVHEAVTQ